MLIGAIYTDVKFEKINNNLIAVGFAGVILKLIFDFSGELLVFTLAGVLFPVVSLFLLFSLNMMGAGDIKLLSVIGGFFELRGAVFCLIISIFVGAVISLYKMCRYHLFYERFSYFTNYLRNYLKTGEAVSYCRSSLPKGAKLNFAIPIAISVVIYYLCVRGGMFI